MEKINRIVHSHAGENEVPRASPERMWQIYLWPQTGSDIRQVERGG